MAYSSTLKMKAAGSSETIIPFYQAVRRHIPEDGNLHIPHRVSLKSSMNFSILRQDWTKRRRAAAFPASHISWFSSVVPDKN
jgi:hypothetical protein